MSQLFLIRHAQSQNNANPEHLRIPDPGLTELGQRQAAYVAKWLSRHEITRLYASPFLRALETVEPIAAQTGLPVSVRADIFEQGGCYRGHKPGEEIGQPGMSRTQIYARYPDWQIDEAIGEDGWWRSRPYESLAQALARARRVAEWLFSEIGSSPGCHAIVTHGDFKRLLVEELVRRSGDEHTRAPIVNTSVTRFVFRDNAWQMDWYNSAEHLTDDLITL